MTKTIEDSVHVQNEERQSKEKHLTHAAWMCAAAVFLTFSYANQMVAQTLVKSNEIFKTQDADGNNGTTSSTTSGTSTADLLDQLNGTNVSYDNASKVVTTGRPKAKSDDAKRIFLLYNVGTHKFLNLGGYWGTHASLSEVPRFFCLQRRNDGTYTEKTYDSDGNVKTSTVISNRKDNLWAMVRYPEKDSDGKLCQVLKTDYTNPLKNFIGQTTFQVGTAEGTTRTNATYKSVVYHKEGIVDVEDSHSNVLKDGVTNPYGRAFAKEFSGNLSDKVIEATIDLSTCHSGENENVLSIGTNIASTSEGNNLHFYYDGTNLTVKSNNGATVADVTNSSTVTSPVDIRLHKNGLYIGSEQVLTADNAIVSSLLSMDASSSAIQIGSQAGNVHSYATYNNLTCTTLAAEGVAENVVTPGYNSNGKKFVKHFPGNLNDYTIEAEIDLSTCKEPQGGWMYENILSIGQDISEANGNNVHLQYGETYSNIPFNFVPTAEPTYFPSVDKDKKLCTIKLNKEELVINGVTYKVANVPELQKLLDESVTELQIGSMADIIKTSSCGRSNATYKSLTIIKNKKDAEVVDPNVIKPSTSANGEAFFKRFESNPSTKTITADIDLSTCEEGQEETVFSFGTNIDNETAGDNDIVFHVTYKKGDTTAKYTISGSGENGGGELDVYAVDKTKPTLHFEYKDGKLTYTIWAWPITVTSNFYSILNDADKVKSFVAGSTMGNHSHATYNTFTVEDTSTSSAAKRKPASTRSASRAVGGDEDENLYVSGTDDTKSGYVRTVKGVNFANEGECINAEIDLSTCTTAKENVFSIGQDIRVWGNVAVAADKAPDGKEHTALPADQGNLHIYYLGKDETNFKLFVAMINKDHPDDLKRMVYVPVDQTMKLTLSKNYLVINGTTIYTDHNPMPTIPECDGHEGEIVRFKYADKANKIFELDENNKYVIVAPGEAGYDDAHGTNASYEGWLYTNESRSDNTSSSNKNMQYFISSDFILDTDKLSKNEGNYFGWAPKLPGKNFGSVGVFADRNLPQGDIWNGYNIWHGDTQTSEEIAADKELARNSMQWHFHPVTNDWDNTTTYNIYLEMSDIQIPQRSSSATDHIIWETKSGTKRYYLQATQQDVFGSKQENYYTTDDYNDVSSGNYDGVEALESTVDAANRNTSVHKKYLTY